VDQAAEAIDPVDLFDASGPCRQRRCRLRGL
jgi:hypothetical protein